MIFRQTRWPATWAAVVAGLLALALPPVASADETVLVCDIYGNHVAFHPRDTRGIHATSICPGNPARARYSAAHPPGGMAIWTVAHRAVRRGQGVHWTITAPQGLRIISIDVPHMYSRGLDDGGGWVGDLYWAGGSGVVRTFDGESSWSSANHGGAWFRWPKAGTRYFGWRISCRARRCAYDGHQWLSLELVELRVRETTGPHLVAPDGLWRATGWIRGVWPLRFRGESPTGLCATGSAINGRRGPGSIVKRDATVWHQCAAPAVDQKVNTAQYGQGALPLTIGAIDGAGASVSLARTIHVDNHRPTVSLSGPSDASSYQGTQYVHANARAGPSGVMGIDCSIDHTPARWYPSPSAAIPVQGVGIHHLMCFSMNRARNASGRPATSTHATWTLRIRSPSVSTVSFVKVTGARHRVSVRRLQVRFGVGATLVGWLGTKDGTRLGGQRVWILTATDNGSPRFRIVRAVTTASDGRWTARLYAGPSRLVEAVYGGGPRAEPSVSRPAQLRVSAGIRLHIRPRLVHWGQTVRIRGSVLGGYVPPAGEIVFLWVGWRGGSTYVGHVYARSAGRFSSTYTFFQGRGTLTYHFWAKTGRENDYPYTPGRSNRVSVRVSP
jgi:hypothetical protein